MDGLESKLNKILSDPQALGSVLEMAKSLNLGGGGPPEGESAVESDAHGSEAPGGLGELLGGLDPAAIGTMMEIMGDYTKDDDRRVQLFKALKPYVRSERRSKMDRAAQIIKMAKMARKAMGSFGGKE